MKKAILLVLFFFVRQVCSQTVPSYYTYDKDFSKSLQEIVNSLELNKNFSVGEDGEEQISFAVIDLNGPVPVIGGVNMENFIYPASVYKMYVAAQVLAQVSAGKYSLYEPYVTKAPNVVDRSLEIKTDPRPLIKEGDTLNVNYLLDLMITRSDNSAANCMIDIAGRQNINEMMHHYGWQGSEVTRKFLKRKYEDPGYDTVRSTMTSALHAADYMYRVYNNDMINPWVSMQLKSFFGRQLDKSKLASGLPANVMYYNKTGWFSYWTNDVGIVDDGKVRYIISCFIPLEEDQARPKMKELSSRVYKLISERHKKQS
ncbi:MAG: serine hydrolase [Ignavibacteria bacterium]|jgi:beta-lactamase class A|nr:serine hydrolase [Ignavibacteria bacterium]MCU7503270.1 serine hydrolase [Ignavibacteria bacterium]MCU7515784.1 serine hydrolase [Ignavibacteria bacterium]